MKKLVFTGWLFGAASAAMAHQLPGDETLLTQLSHQVLSPHHLPLLVLAVVAGIFLAWRLRSHRE